jgi:hypothetical protein
VQREDRERLLPATPVGADLAHAGSEVAREGVNT